MKRDEIEVDTKDGDDDLQALDVWCESQVRTTRISSGRSCRCQAGPHKLAVILPKTLQLHSRFLEKALENSSDQCCRYHGLRNIEEVPGCPPLSFWRSVSIRRALWVWDTGVFGFCFCSETEATESVVHHDFSTCFQTFCERTCGTGFSRHRFPFRSHTSQSAEESETSWRRILSSSRDRGPCSQNHDR